MRLWSLHLSLLDSKGLVALGREALLAQSVLQGKTKGYRRHSQLHRSQQLSNPLGATYLWAIHDEATRRGYAFDASRIVGERRPPTINVSKGQLAFERKHLQEKRKGPVAGRVAKLGGLPRRIGQCRGALGPCHRSAFRCAGRWERSRLPGLR